MTQSKLTSQSHLAPTTVTTILVTSAGSANGGGHGALLSFDSSGGLIGAFSSDPRIVDPRGLSLDPASALIYLNSGDDRVLALDRGGEVVRESGRIPGIGPGGAHLGRTAATTSACAAGGRSWPCRRLWTGLRSLFCQPARPGPTGVRPCPRRPAVPRVGRRSLRKRRQHDGRLRSRRQAPHASPGRRPRAKPLDVTLAHNGHIVVARECPFGASDAVTSVREYDPTHRTASSGARARPLDRVPKAARIAIGTGRSSVLRRRGSRRRVRVFHGPISRTSRAVAAAQRPGARTARLGRNRAHGVLQRLGRGPDQEQHVLHGSGPGRRRHGQPSAPIRRFGRRRPLPPPH